MASFNEPVMSSRLESAVSRKGRGNQEDLYMIGLGVEPCRKSH